MWAIYSEPRVREHLITKPQTRDEFSQVFRTMLHYSAQAQLWGVTEKDSERLIGRCGFYEFSEARTPELAYLFSEDSGGAARRPRRAMPPSNSALSREDGRKSSHWFDQPTPAPSGFCRRLASPQWTRLNYEARRWSSI